VPDSRQSFSESGVESDPISQFSRWYERALEKISPLPESVALATATRSGHPSLRMVLLKGYDAHGFVIFTNYQSRKGRELTRNPRASLVFHWGSLQQQVRVEGRVMKVTVRESDDYFATRPRGSQLSAWASAQSSKVASRSVLEQRFASFERKYPGAVPRPPHWGGFRLVPDQVEFWQGRADRLHDRIVYRRAPRGRWTIERLAP
jgi:pyridoxamine 5'-phosphate oxidase